MRARAGTAVRARGLRRHDEILDAATALLVDEGHAAFSARKIAARVGIRLGNLQYYFPTRQAVLRALLERFLERSTADLERAMGATSGAPAERLHAGLDAIVAQHRAPESCDLFCEVWALAARDPEVGRAVDSFYAAYRAGVAHALLATCPGLGRARAGRRATLLVALLEGLTLFRTGSSRRMRGERELIAELHELVRWLAEEDRT